MVYLPEGRIGNVLCRPVLRDYEIPYLGRSGAPPDRQLPVSDLLVGIEDGRLVLYSRRLGRRIVPRLTNAHGFMNPQLASVYRFLCNLQHQEGGSIPGLSWGGLETLDFLPRVRIGRVVLSLARWRLSKEDIDALTKPAKAARFLAMQELRERRGLPRWVVFEEGDHTLPTDLDNPLSVDALVHVLKRGSAALLTEMYPKPDELCVTSVEGRFCHELNVPMVLRAPAEKSPAAGPRAGGGATVALASARIARNARALPPGGEWLYLKLYGGGATLDEVLTTALPPVTEAARARGAVSRWFFVRYTDPHEHLRIRLNGPPDQLTREVLPLVAKAFNPLLASGRLWKIQLDTYEREIERYGGAEAARAAEDVFFADSEAVLEILRGSPGDEGMDLRWRVGLRGVDRLLSDCGLDVEARRTAVGRWRDDYQREFQTSGEVKKQLGDKFRAERRSLEALFWNAPEPGTALERAWQALDRRSGRIAEAVRLLQSLAAAGELPLEIPELAASYAHMHINRLIRSSARQHELVLYDFLFRLYDGKIATRKRAQPGAAETAPQSEEPPDRRVS